MKLLKKSNKSFLILVSMYLLACNNGKTGNAHENEPAENNVALPSVISYDIIHMYPHDPTAFTEGLEYRDGFLYESTGQYGSSDIRKVELATGKVLLSTKMEGRYFGEGLTIMDGKIYQLTYREGKGFIYDLPTLKLLQTFTFKAAEGWGMTNNGAWLIYDDGTNLLHFLDPQTMNEVKTLVVTDEHGPVNEINEPELIHGFIYANQWRTDNILKIDTLTGHVVARADLSTLREKAGIPPISGSRSGPDVLNGIAYDAVGNRIFVTGKNWPKLIEIRLDN